MKEIFLLFFASQCLIASSPTPPKKIVPFSALPQIPSFKDPVGALSKDSKAHAIAEYLLEQLRSRTELQWMILPTFGSGDISNWNAQGYDIDNLSRLELENIYSNLQNVQFSNQFIQQLREGGQRRYKTTGMETDDSLSEDSSFDEMQHDIPMDFHEIPGVPSVLSLRGHSNSFDWEGIQEYDFAKLDKENDNHSSMFDLPDNDDNYSLSSLSDQGLVLGDDDMIEIEPIEFESREVIDWDSEEDSSTDQNQNELVSLDSNSQGSYQQGSLVNKNGGIGSSYNFADWNNFLTTFSDSALNDKIKEDDVTLDNFHYTEHQESRQVYPHYNSIQKITDHLSNLFEDTLFSEEIPWNKLDEKDFIGWPSGLKVKDPLELEEDEFSIFEKTFTKIQLSQHFLDTYNSRFLESKTEAVNIYLLKKLNQQSNRRHSMIPWNILNDKDIKDWPRGVPLKNPELLRPHELDVLFDDMNNLEFSGEFANRMKVLLPAGFKPLKSQDQRLIATGRIIDDYISKKLCNSLRNIQSTLRVISIPWDQISSSDFIGWPFDVPVMNPMYLSSDELEELKKSLGAIQFKDEFIFKISTYYSKLLLNACAHGNIRAIRYYVRVLHVPIDDHILHASRHNKDISDYLKSAK